MANELRMAWAYFRAVVWRWWVITIELVLVTLDVVERVLGKWFLPPLWAKVVIGSGVLVIAQYLVYRDLQKTLVSGATPREKLTRLAACMKAGRQFLYTPSAQSGWVAWASNVDDWAMNTFKMLESEFGTLAVEKFVNDAGMLSFTYPGVPAEFQQRMLMLNRRLQNLQAIAEQPNVYL